MPENNQDNQAFLYENLIKNGLTENEIGNVERFKSYLSNPDNVGPFYDKLIENGFKEENVGTADQFKELFSEKKKPEVIGESIEKIPTEDIQEERVPQFPSGYSTSELEAGALEQKNIPEQQLPVTRSPFAPGDIIPENKLTENIQDANKLPSPEKEDFNSLKERTLQNFYTNKIFDNPRNREIYYKALENKGYDVKQIRKVGDTLARYNPELRAANKKLNENPDDINAIGEMAGLQSAIGNDKGSMGLFSKVLEQDPNDDKAHYGMGYALMNMGDSENAIDSFNKAIESNPNNANAYNARAYMYSKIGGENNLNKALNDVNRSIELDPSGAGANYLNKATILASIGDSKGAKTAFDEGKRLASLEALPDIKSIGAPGTPEWETEQRANVLKDTAKAIENGEGLFVLFNPLGNIVNGTAMGIQEGIKQIGKTSGIARGYTIQVDDKDVKIPAEGKWAALANYTSGLAKVGFAAATPFSPMLRNFTTGVELAKEFIWEDVIKFVTAPVSLALEKAGITPNSEGWKSTTELADLVGALIIMRGTEKRVIPKLERAGAKMIEVGDKIMERKKLNGEMINLVNSELSKMSLSDIGKLDSFISENKLAEKGIKGSAPIKKTIAGEKTTSMPSEIKVDVPEDIKPAPVEITEPIIPAEPQRLSDLAPGDDIKFKGQEGKLGVNEDGAPHITTEDGKVIELPVEDKNNLAVDLKELGLEYIPKISESEIARAHADAEMVGTFKSPVSGSELFISLANPKMDNIVGDIVGKVMPDGSIRRLYTNDNPLSRSAKLDVINQFLESKGLQKRKSLVDSNIKEPISGEIIKSDVVTPETKVTEPLKPTENIKEGIKQESNGSELPGVEKGQPEIGTTERSVGETTQPKADSSNRPIDSGKVQEEIIQEPGATVESVTPPVETAPTEVPVTEKVESVPQEAPPVTEEITTEETISEPATPIESEYKVGDKVSFNRFGEWIDSTIKAVNKDGTYDVKSDRGTNYSNQSIKDISSKMEPGGGVVDRALNFLDSLKIENDRSSLKLDITLGIGRLVWNASIDIIKAGIRAGRTASEATQDAVDYIIKTHGKFDEQKYRDFYKDVFDKSENKLRKEVTDRLSDKFSEIEKEIFGSKTKRSKDFTAGGTISKALGIVQRVQEKTIGKLSEKGMDAMARVMAKATTSENAIVEAIGHGFRGVFDGVTRTEKQIAASDKFAGEAMQRSIADANVINRKLRELIGNDRQSLRNIDKVLDPDFYREQTKDEYLKETNDYIGDEEFNKLSDAEKDSLYKNYRDGMGFDEPGYKEFKYDDLSDTEKKAYELIKMLYDFTHDANFSIGRTGLETYVTNKGKYTARMYDIYEMPKDVNDMISASTKKMQLGMYKEKGTLSDWKREHKIDDPVYAVSKRVYQTLLNKGIVDYTKWLKLKTPEVISPIEKTGFTKLEGKAYGDLNGKFVRNDIAEDFKGHFFANEILQSLHGTLKKYDRLAPRQFYKKLFTVWNPGVHIGNMTGNFVFATWVGVSPVRFAANLYKARKEARDYSPTYRYLLSKGLLKTDLTREDLANSLDALEEVGDRASKEKNPIKRFDELAQSVYAATDDLGKIAAFNSLVEIGFTPDVAIKKVAEGFQNYRKVGKYYDLTSKLPVIGQPFGKFAGDLARITATGILKRPLNLAAFVGTIHALSNLTSHLSGESDRDKSIRENRMGAPKIPMPDWLGGDVPLSFKTGDNELNVARFLSPLYVYENNESTAGLDLLNKLSPFQYEHTERTMNQGGTMAVTAAKLLKDPLIAPIGQWIVDSDFKGKPIEDPASTLYNLSRLSKKERNSNSIRFMARAYLPFGGLMDDFLIAFRGEEDRYGRERTPVQVSLRFFGYNAQVFTQDKYYKVLENEIKTEAYYFVANAKKIKETSEDLENEKITQEVYEERMTEFLEDQAKTVSKLKKKIDKAMPDISVEGIENTMYDAGMTGYDIDDVNQ